MKIIYSRDHIQHNPPYEIWYGNTLDYLETPSRAYSIVAAIKKKNRWQIQEPSEDPNNYIQTTHTPRIIDFLRTNDKERLIKIDGNSELVLGSDESVSLSPGTYDAARSAVSSAVSGAEIIIKGLDRAVYSLCRPPGHHATRNKVGGFCFFNNAAISAKKLLAQGKVAVLDIDLHHGNGTQDILYDLDGAMYVSLNGADVYPYILTDGRQSSTLNTDRIVNFTVSPDAGDKGYLSLIDESMSRIRAHKSDVIVVSAGFDTSENELPDLEKVNRMKLTRECYYKIGRKVRDSGLPILAVQEGGYNITSLGEDVLAFLEGVDSR